MRTRLPARALPALCLAATLSACSMVPLPDIPLPALFKPSHSHFEGADPGKQTSSEARRTTAKVDTIAFADAYCRGNADMALAATRPLLAAHPGEPRVELVHAFALDLGGHGVNAFGLLEKLAAADHRVPVALRCGDRYVYSGPLSEVAQRRHFAVRTRLEALGVRFPLPGPAETAGAGNVIAVLASAAQDLPPTVPAASPVAAAATPAPATAAAAPAAPARPAAGKPAGGLFVHLGSYRTRKTLDSGWKRLKARHAALLEGRAMTVSKVDLGKKKGRFLRLGVTVAGRKAADRLCSRLKAGGQYCNVLAKSKS